jgi:DedD protein
VTKPVLRERLIGVLIIAALGLILYPFVFQGESQYLASRDDLIPPRPPGLAVRPLEVPVPPPGIREPASQPLFVPVETAVVDPEPEPILNEQGMPNAWVLQAGSFASRDNAEQLLQTLIEGGLKAYVRVTPGEAGGPDLYRVFVGPMLDSREVERQREQIQRVSGIDPISLRYTP